MPILASCTCGESYNLKDEFAGRTLKCPKCGATISVGGTPAAVQPQADPAFDRDKFLLRQKHLSISEKYYVWDEQGSTILFVERPAHLLRNLGAVFTGMVAMLVVVGIFGALSTLLPGDAAQVVVIGLGVVAGIAALQFVGMALYVKRHVTFYRDDTRREPLLEVIQEKKWEFPTSRFTVRDPEGQPLAILTKNYLYDIFRKRWHCQAPDGSLWLVAQEDSILLSLLRRLIGPLFGLLRTNFVITHADGQTTVGEFNRQLTLLDRYVLDLSADPARAVDRRVAIAMGVMLDTGERR